MTKKQAIEDLARQGKGKIEIAALTGYSRPYIKNVIEEMRKPGVLRKRREKWLAKFGSITQYRQTTEGGRNIIKRGGRALRANHYNATRPSARNHGKQWTTREIEHLEQHGKEKSIRQLALDLGRTYRSVQSAANKFGIDLRGDKMGANGNKFKEIYAQKTASPAATS